MKAKRKSIKSSCQAVKPDGTRCQAAKLPGSDYCFFHDPSLAAERRAAQSAGGSRIKTLAADAPDVMVGDTRDVVKLIEATVNQVRRGQVDPRVANSVGYLAAILLRAVEQGTLEGKVAELEAIIKARGNAASDLALTGDS